MKNIANADRPKSAAAMLPPRPLRGSRKIAQTACNSDRREGKSCIPTLNQTFADSRILKISKLRTFRIAARSVVRCPGRPGDPRDAAVDVSISVSSRCCRLPVRRSVGFEITRTHLAPLLAATRVYRAGSEAQTTPDVGEWIAV